MIKIGKTFCCTRSCCRRYYFAKRRMLTNTRRSIRNHEKFRYAGYIFPSMLNSAITSAKSKSASTTDFEFETGYNEDIANDAVSTAKRLRLSLLQETSLMQSAEAENPVQTEIRKYMGIYDNSTALQFWERAESSFPILSSMARIYLSISSGSVPVESLFSTAGLILNSKRSSLMPHRSNMISFIHDNYDLL